MNSTSSGDFGELVLFLRAFSLQAITDDSVRLAALKRAHKQFLAILTVASELMDNSSVVGKKFAVIYGQPGAAYLGEVVSDCSEFMMSLVLGMHRSAGGTLRSAIESYLKAFSAVQVPEILTRTSVPQVFADAENSAMFTAGVGKEGIAELKGYYSQLNSFVHTVSAQHMFSALAIGSFPRWPATTDTLVETFTKVTRVFIWTIVGMRRDLYDQFDHRNKAIAVQAMTRVQRRRALGVDDPA
ncbi:MAG: hypothetical protein JNL19_01160 [Burkholderiales bacterium]|nr:hypothetical protein [Burkholderiales bacterium]